MRGETKFMWLALASSSATLVCCALPALLVSLGAGAALAALVSAVPALVWVSRHHTLVFSVAGLMLVVGGVLMSRPAACPLDPKLAAACGRYKRFSRVAYSLAVLAYLVGAFFAYILPAILSHH